MSKGIKACTMVATQRGYYGRLLEAGEEFEFQGGVKPTWAEPADTRVKGSVKAKGDVTPKAKANAKVDAKADRTAKAEAKAATRAAEKERAEQRKREKAEAEGAGALLTEIGS